MTGTTPDTIPQQLQRVVKIQPRARSETPPLFAANPETRGRLTVTEMVYHQVPGEQPTIWETQYVRSVDREAQPYLRRCKATEEWQPLDLGWSTEWPDGASLLTLRNEEGKFAVNPTDEERAESEAKVIELAAIAGGQLVGVILIRPNSQDMRLEPTNLRSLRIRCRSGTARYTMCLFPG